MAVNENSKNVFNYVKSMGDNRVTTNDIAEALDLAPRSVTGSINSWVKKGLMARVEEEIEVEDGKHATVKFIVLTEDGMNFDPDAPVDAE